MGEIITIYFLCEETGKQKMDLKDLSTLRDHSPFGSSCPQTTYYLVLIILWVL